jgi:hypothetical protein
MEFTTEQAKTIFDLIRSASPYAYPLLISLILPIIWVVFKKMLGISNSKNEQNISGNFLSRFKARLRSFFTLDGEVAEKFLFYFCIILFVLGGVLLKIGENNEEVIRQRSLGLKQYLIQWGYNYERISSLKECKLSEKMVNTIIYNYPSEFIRDEEYIYLTDSIAINKIYNFSFPLLASYLDYKFKFQNKIYLDSITCNTKNKNYNNSKDAWNIYDFFDYDIVLKFIGLPENKGKYSIDEIKGQIIIMKNDSL